MGVGAQVHVGKGTGAFDREGLSFGGFDMLSRSAMGIRPEVIVSVWSQGIRTARTSS